MKSKVFHILFPILMCFTAGKIYCQKICDNNFTGLAKAYLEHATKKYKLDTVATVFIASITNSGNREFFYELTFMDTTFLADLKYDAIYALGNFKLVIPKDLDSSGRLANVFKKRPFENLKKDKSYSERYHGEDFHRWYFLMNSKCEIMQGNGKLCTDNKFKQGMKQYKLVFAKDPF